MHKHTVLPHHVKGVHNHVLTFSPSNMVRSNCNKCGIKILVFLNLNTIENQLCVKCFQKWLEFHKKNYEKLRKFRPDLVNPTWTYFIEGETFVCS